MQRSQPLKRTRMKHRAPRRLSSEEGRDPARIAWLHTQPCCARQLAECPCFGDIEAHHPRDHTGMGLKPKDDDAIPMCSHHHVDDLHGCGGPFKYMHKADRKAWEAAMVERFHALWAMENGDWSGATELEPDEVF